jgi:membrane-bound lytic murein transglycosylase D
MSTDDLRKLRARIEQSDPVARVLQEEADSVRRGVRLAVLLVAALLLVPFAWASRRAETHAVLESVAEGYRASTVLPLQRHPSVDRWMDTFQTSRRGEFQALLARRGAYQALIHRKLRERGMPEELMYVAMMESGLSPLAVSRVSAVGLWQFMDVTARQFGLRVDAYVDERRDPVRATDAALDYLEGLHHRFGSWYLAAAAYNAGPSRLERVLHLHADGRRGEEELYWEVLGHLPRETREYVPRLVAATILGTEAEALGFDLAGAPAYVYDRVFVPGGTRISVIAESLGADLQIVQDLNPHLITGVTPPGEMFAVRVPLGGASAVVASLAPAPQGGALGD